MIHNVKKYLPFLVVVKYFESVIFDVFPCNQFSCTKKQDTSQIAL